MIRILTAAFLIATLSSTGIATANETADTQGWWVKGKIQGYQGLWPLHVAALQNRDFTHPDNPIGWTQVDEETGKFDLFIPGKDVDSIYLLAQLDRDRTGPRLSGNQLFFLQKTPFNKSQFENKRLLFELGDMELAHLIREGNPWHAPMVALGLALLLYGIGFLWVRRLQPTTRTEHTAIPTAGWPLWLIAIGTTVPLLPQLGLESLELLEFTYLHEGLRPKSVIALMTDPISAELSHPPLWPLVLRSLSAISQAEWWLRFPSVLCHLSVVFVVYRLGAHGGNRKRGLLAAALIGIAPIPFYYGQDASPYAWLTLLSASCTLCALREHWKRFAALVILGFFTHYTMAVLAIGIALALLWQWRRDRDDGRMRRAILSYGWICILPLIWSVHFIQTFFASGMSTRLMSADYLPDPGFVSYIGHFLAVVLGLPPEAAIASVAMLLLVIWGATKLKHQTPLLGRLVAIQLALLFGYVLFVYAMYMRFADGRVFFAYRWTSIFLPVVALGSATGLIALWNIRKWIGASAATLVVGAALAQDVRLVTQPQRPAQEEAAQFIRQQSQPGDAFCALPAVYYAQLINFHIEEGQPKDWMAWPHTTGHLYGPFHQRNTTIESLSQNLALNRIWVAVYHEQMFGTRKFDSATSDHQLAWLKANLDFDPTTDKFSFDHLDLYRFHVPHEPQDPELHAWKSGELVLDFSKRLQLFRYFPDLRHTQATGSILSLKTVAVRIPPPPSKNSMLTLEITVRARKPIQATDMLIPGVSLTFSAMDDGGVWRGQLPSSTDRIDFSIRRSEHLAAVHSNTIVRLRPQGPTEQVQPMERK